MKLNKVWIILFAIIPALLLMTGCDSREGDGVDYEITSMTVNPDNLYADDSIDTYSDVRVTVEDNEGYPATGIAVTFQADLGYIQGKVYTDDYGVATTPFNDDGVVGMAHITAFIEGGENEDTMTDSIEIKANSSVKIARITASPDTIYLDNGITTSEIEVLVKDQDDFPATGEAVYFKTDKGNIITNVSTDSSGIATTTFWDAGVQGTALIEAFVGTTDTTISVVIAPQPEVTELSLDVLSNEITINTVRTLEAYAESVIGSVPDGTIITFQTELGYFQTSETDNTYLGKTYEATTSNGTARAFLNSGTQAGVGDITVSIVKDGDGNVLTASEEIEYLAGRPTQMTLITKNEDNEVQSVIPVNSPEDLYVWAYVRDSYGNAVRNDYVVNFTTDLGNILSPVPITDGGIATATFSAGINAGVAQITAEVDSALATTAITVTSDDVNSIEFVIQEQISIDVQGTGGNESAELAVNLYDMNGNSIDEPIEVWFMFTDRPGGNDPDGGNINNVVYNLQDSTSTMSSNGMAVVSVNSGLTSGIIKIRAWCRNDEGIEIYAEKPNIIVQAGPPHKCEFTIAGNDAGEDMSGGIWKVQIAALITDIEGNPVGDGTAVYFNLDPNPEYASIFAADAFVGNENANGDTLAGTAFSYITYDGTHTNEVVHVMVQVGNSISFDGDLKLPLQLGELTMIAVPAHVDWIDAGDEDDKMTQCRLTVRDGQNNPISYQRIVFTSSLGDPIDDDIHPVFNDIDDTVAEEYDFDWASINTEGDPNDGYTGWYEGELGRLYKWNAFHKYECPEPVPTPPGMTTASITANIFGTNTSVNQTITLFRYTD